MCHYYTKKQMNIGIVLVNNKCLYLLCCSYIVAKRCAVPHTSYCEAWTMIFGEYGEWCSVAICSVVARVSCDMRKTFRAGIALWIDHTDSMNVFYSKFVEQSFWNWIHLECLDRFIWFSVEFSHMFETWSYWTIIIKQSNSSELRDSVCMW